MRVYTKRIVMAQYFEVHPENPQLRLIRRAAEIIRDGGVIVYPTDSSYAIACRMGDKQALDKIRRIRRLDDKHNFTLVCKDLTQVSAFGRMDNEAFRLIKALTPGPFTFVLKATSEVPRRLQHPNRKTVGIRIPDHPVPGLLLQELDEALFTSTMSLPGQEPFSDPYEIRTSLEHELDLIIDAGIIDYAPTTIITFENHAPTIVRQGKGIATMLE